MLVLSNEAISHRKYFMLMHVILTIKHLITFSLKTDIFHDGHVNMSKHMTMNIVSKKKESSIISPA